MAVLVADLTDIVDLIAAADTGTLDQGALAVRTLLGTVDLGLIRDAVAHSVDILVWRAHGLDLGLAIEGRVDLWCVVLWLVAFLAEAGAKTPDVGPVGSLALASDGSSL